MVHTRKIVDLPELIPVLPVRNTVLFPNAAVPLIVGRPRSVQTIREAQKKGDLVLVLSQKDGSKEDPGHPDLYQIGVVCLISKLMQLENDSYQLIANGLLRFQVTEFVEQTGYLSARGHQIPEAFSESPARVELLAGEVKQLGKHILGLASIPGSDALSKLFNQLSDPGQISDLCCTFLQLSITIKQQLLETRALDKRLEMLLEYMVREKERLLLQNEIQAKMAERLSKDQRDHLLREQIKTIHEELGDESGFQDELQKRIEQSGMNPEAKKIVREEAARLNVVQRTSPEYHVIRSYLDAVLALPWNKIASRPSSEIDLDEARKILDEEHFGIEKVKDRIIQFLAVAKLKEDLRGSILCLLGPPGVGKTSVGKSIAKALGRPFVRTSLGGVRDEAEIRGHRRTYVGAMPGRILQSMKRVQASDPLMLLDEIDKLGTDFRGDPASALLEVLDPEQNQNFVDHYLDVPFDLSKVFFVTTANVLDAIPAALRDRLEVIEMGSYSLSEKLEIAKRHLIDKEIRDHGMLPENIEIYRDALAELIHSYTREAGVRQLRREIARLCRYAAEKIVRGNDRTARLQVTAAELPTILGPKKYHGEVLTSLSRAGVVTGLAWTPSGGETLTIEVAKMAGKGTLLLTGQLGDVMKESAQIALSLLRTVGNFPSETFDKTDFHVHVPQGAIPKDGPSAGIALFSALTSLMLNKAIDPHIAMTGEITLRGNVLPVGGIREKVLAAARLGVNVVILPEKNRVDVTEVPAEASQNIRFHFVETVDEALRVLGLLPSLSPVVSPEPRLNPVAPMLSN